MKGTIVDFLKLTSEKPELRSDLIGLAARHGFEFTDELSDADLESVAGGGSGGLDTFSTSTSDGAVPIPYPSITTSPAPETEDPSGTSGDETDTTSDHGTLSAGDIQQAKAASTFMRKL